MFTWITLRMIKRLKIGLAGSQSFNTLIAQHFMGDLRNKVSHKLEFLWDILKNVTVLTTFISFFGRFHLEKSYSIIVFSFLSIPWQTL